MTTTSERLKEAIAMRGLKQIDITNSTGISKGALSSYLSGRYEPKQNNIYLLAKCLGVNEAWLMGYDVPMHKSSSPAAPSDNKKERLVAYYDSFNKLGKDKMIEYAELLDKDDKYKIPDDEPCKKGLLSTSENTA